MEDGPQPLDRMVCIWILLKCYGIFLILASILQMLTAPNPLSIEVTIWVVITIPLFVGTCVFYMAFFDHINKWYVGYAIGFPIGCFILVYSFFILLLQLPVTYIFRLLPLNFLLPISVIAFIVLPLNFIYFLRNEQRTLAKDWEELHASINQ